MPEPKLKHGGERKGAGRKSSNNVQILVRLPAELIADLDAEVARRKAAGEKPVPSRSSVLAVRIITGAPPSLPLLPV